MTITELDSTVLQNRYECYVTDCLLNGETPMSMKDFLIWEQERGDQ